MTFSFLLGWIISRFVFISRVIYHWARLCKHDFYTTIKFYFERKVGRTARHSVGGVCLAARARFVIKPVQNVALTLYTALYTHLTVVYPCERETQTRLPVDTNWKPNGSNNCPRVLRCTLISIRF
jgi:hypothetical protein